MMKRGIAIALTVVMAVGMIGCGKSSSSKGGSVELGQYKGLTVYEDDINVSDEDYQSTVKNILSQAATTEQVKEGEVKDDSVVNVDYTGTITVKGKPFEFEGGSAKGTSINMASDSAGYIDGFVSALKGKKVGDTFDAKLKFPKDYKGTTKDGDGKEIKLAGKKVTFKFTINYLEVTNTPELTDEFVKKNYGAYGVTDVKSFEEYAKKQMRIGNIMNSVWQNFLDSCEVKSYNEKEVESMEKYYNDYYEQYYQYQYGASIEKYLEAASMSQSDWDAQIKETSETALKERMIINKIAEKEKLKPNDKQYESEANVFVEQYTMKNVAELESQYGADEVMYAIVYQKVREFIADNVKVEKGSAPTTEAAAEATTAAK